VRERDVREVMFASESQSPIITSMGSKGWFVASARKACRRSEAEPDAPVVEVSWLELSAAGRERGG
jgi:hypothetical protein